MHCWKCQDTGSYRVARIREWLTRKGPRSQYEIVRKKCDCKAKVSSEKAGESA
jgi:hypothetical protein